MKFTMKAMMALLFMVMLSSATFAQSKIGYVNSDAVITMLPSYETAQQKFNTYAETIPTEAIKSKANELETKYNAFQAESATMSETRRQVVAQEIMKLEQELNQLHQQNQTQQKVSQKEQELFAPIEKEAQDLIAKVAKAQGFTMVVDAARTAIVYADDAANIMPFIKAELGK